MDESERLQRIKQRRSYYDLGAYHLEDEDDALADRIVALLNHPKIDSDCMVDAYYYDFSVIPDEIRQKNNFYRDMYMLFGITTEGEVVTKWVERYDLDCDYPIVNGTVIKPEKKGDITIPTPPQILQCFDKDLLSTPCTEFSKLFGKHEHVE